MQIYPPNVGGSIHGYQLAKCLTTRGHHLYSWYYGDDENPFCKHFRGRELFRFLRTIDVLYIRIEWAALLRWQDPLQLLLRMRVPSVYEFNGLPDEIRYRSDSRVDIGDVAAKLCKLARRGHAAIGVTEGIRKYLDEKIGFRKNYCVPNGSDPVLFNPSTKTSKSSEALQVVWMGSTKAGWHDTDAIVEAAQILHERRINVQFRIYGDPTYLLRPMPPNLRVCGSVPYDRLGSEISDGDVGLHIFRSLQEVSIDGSPLKVFDYMACGLATIAQGYGQSGEIIQHRNNGLITSGTPEDLADKIEILEQDRDLCMRLGQNGRRAVCSYYNWERVAKETELALMDVLKNRESA
jgi:glycosyltransferase involved in cell wall biosynthesis